MPYPRAELMHELVTGRCDNQQQPYARSSIQLIFAGPQGLPRSCVCVLIGCNALGQPVVVVDLSKPDALKHVITMLEDA